MNLYDPIEFYDDFLQRERFILHTELAITNPRAQMKFANVSEPPRIPWPLKMMEIDWLPDGDEGFLMTGIGDPDVFVLPKYNRYGERAGLQALKKTPLWTRHTLGVREAARTRRRAR